MRSTLAHIFSINRAFRVVFMLCILLFWHSPNGIAQDIKVHFEHFNEFDGLDEKRTNCVMKHSNGYVYVGTYDGVYRFDGYSFSPIPHTNREYNIHTYTSAYVIRINELEDGRILTVYQPPLEVPVDCDIYDPVSGQVEPHKLHAIDAPHNTANIDGKDFPLVNKPMNVHFENGVAKDNAGNSLFLKEGDDQNVILEISGHRRVELGDLWKSGQKTWRGLYSEDFSQELYLVSHSGLLKIDIEPSSFTTYLTEEAQEWEYQLSGRAIAFPDSNTVAFSSTQKPLVFYDKTTKQYSSPIIKDSESGLPQPMVTARALFMDGDSILWFPDISGWLFRIHLPSLTSTKVLDTTFTKLITAARSPNDHIFLARYDTDLESPGTLYNWLYDYDPINDELIEYETVSAFFSQSYHRVTQIRFAEDGHLWYGTTLGLFRIDLAKQEIVAEYYTQSQFDQMWDKERESRQHFILSGKGILALYENDQKELFVGLEGGGLNILDSAYAKCKVWTKSNGLAGNKVCSIEENETGFWIGTYSGLSHFNREAGTWRTFERKNGLPHSELNRFSSAQSPQGEMFFGGMNGYFSFDPREVLKSDEEVKVLLSEAKYFDKAADTTITQCHTHGAEPHYVIPSNNRACSFTLALSQMSNAAEHSYMYNLREKGEESFAEWRIVGQDRTIRFEHLPAGEYELIAKGTTSTGIPSAPLTIHLDVQEYFYKTWWFMVLCILVGLAIALVFYRVRVAQVIREERLRTQLSSDLHDDVGSVLSGVAYQMELLAHTVDEKQKDLAMRVAESSRKAMYQMRDVVWAIDSGNGKGIDLSERMKEFAREHLEVNAIDCHFTIGKDVEKIDLSSEIRHSLLLIFKEFGTNTIKHSGAKNMHVQLDKNGKSMTLSCSDDGKGNQDKTSTGQGLRNMKMRATKLGGTFEIAEKEGFGIVVRIPV